MPVMSFILHHRRMVDPPVHLKFSHLQGSQ
uniref:Uncharacterized protein n=1 Tax=Anguilla anguilla TaxID=7936 RepID=A0A0E9TIL6_ANGAN